MCSFSIMQIFSFFGGLLSRIFRTYGAVDIFVCYNSRFVSDFNPYIFVMLWTRIISDFRLLPNHSLFAIFNDMCVVEPDRYYRPILGTF